MNLDNLDKFLEKVPMHYGEAVQLYPWIKETDCEDYEWCDRTSLENSIWLIEQLELQLSKFRQGAVIDSQITIDTEIQKALNEFKPNYKPKKNRL